MGRVPALDFPSAAPEVAILNQGVGTVRVTEAGTYTIMLYAAFFPGVPGCDITFAQTVEVTGCSSDSHSP